MANITASRCAEGIVNLADVKSCAGYAVPQSDSGSTIAPSTPASTRTRSSTSGMSTQSSIRSYKGSSHSGICWQDMRLGHRIQPSFKYAHRASDAYLLSCFLDLAEVKDISCESTKLLLRTVKMLRACDFSNEDISSVLAHASKYFIDVYAQCGADMEANEIGNVIGLLIFLGHSYVLDETCRLKVWHKYLFATYCSLGMLSSAVMRLMEVLHYTLRVEDEDLHRRYTALLGASAAHQVLPRTGSDILSSPSSPAFPSPSFSDGSRLSGGSGVANETRSAYCASDGESSVPTVRSLFI